MFPPLQLWVRTPAETVLRADGVRWVQAQLADGGGIGIWPGHAPMLAETVTAPLRYEDAHGEHSVTVNAGILQVTPGQVRVYVSGAESEQAAEGEANGAP